MYSNTPTKVRKTVLAALACLAALSAYGDDDMAGLRTAGTGQTYNFAKLSTMEGSGVRWIDGQPGYYAVERNDTIDASDIFEIDEGVTVKFADKISFVIEGTAALKAPFDNPTTFTRLNDSDTPYCIRIEDHYGVIMSNLNFEYLGVEVSKEDALMLNNCSFKYHNGSTAAALYFVKAGGSCTINDCHFEECQKAAIGSAANAQQDFDIHGSTFIRNSTLNRNIPQINVTAANIGIADCTIIGDSTSLTSNNMVGGIGVSNFMGYEDTKLGVYRCTISHNRYGIGTVGPVSDVQIWDNVITDNNHEAKPMNGGSGISFYDPYRQTCAVVAGNRIAGNCWGVTIIGCKDVNLGQPASSVQSSPGGNVFADNGNDGVPYDLYNNSDLTVYAQNNTWGVDEQTEEKIETVIFHKNDDEKLGQVIFMPAAGGSAGINNIENEGRSANDRAYSLSGIRLHNSDSSRISIENGKKVLRK